jgi:predicted nucleic acid-binding protein
MLVLVDTNVLLRIVDATHALHIPATKAVRNCLDAGCVLCVVPQIHYEFWVVATRPIAQNGLGLSAANAEAQLRTLGPPLFRLLRDERAIYNLWRELVVTNQVQGKNAHDARIVAAMQRHDVTHLMTFNGPDFRRFPDIHLLDPTQDIDLS